MTHHMLVAIDDSRESLAAARTAGRWALETAAQVRLLAVLEDDHVGEAVEAAAGPRSHERRAEAVDHLLAFVAGELHRAGLPEAAVTTRRDVGDPFQQILDEARAWPADLIVMAVSDRRGLRSNYVGSVTQQVIEFADCPVLVVPATPG